MRFDADELTGSLLGCDPLTIGIAPGESVAIDLRGYEGDLTALSRTAAWWLERLPCPAIAVGSPSSPLPGFDLLVATDADLLRVERAISAHPIAASVLIQVLRLVERLPLIQGLQVESLAFATLQQGPEFLAWLKRRRSPEPAGHDTTEGPPVLADRNGSRLEILLNRPNVRNEIDVKMRDALCEVFASAALDPEIDQIHVFGSGDSFSTGGALSEFGLVASGAQAHLIRCERLPARLLLDIADKCCFHIQGACIGAGLEIAAFGAKVVASPNAFFRLPELSMGLIPGAGGCVSVTRRIGRQRAAWMMLTGQRVTARTALTWGLIDSIDDRST